jgi:hypothetical protein
MMSWVEPEVFMFPTGEGYGDYALLYPFLSFFKEFFLPKFGLDTLALIFL